MKLILSRKGFDSAAGGCPSPILPDGRLCSLPIPDSQSLLHYRELTVNCINAGKLVADLTGNPKGGDETAHLDPDIDPAIRIRETGWRGLLGQDGTAQSHLRNQNVGVGDLFLFFGLFRPVEQVDGRWRFIKAEPARHVIWGWLQVAAVHRIAELEKDALPWARYHPHFAGERGAQNTLYEASDSLVINNRKVRQKDGYGTFSHYAPKLQLTAQESKKPSVWRLPASFFPSSSATALTYHQKLERWQQREDHCLLNAAARGQEFVLDLQHYPALAPWIVSLIQK